MKFLAKYIHRQKEKPEYWRTLYADTVNEAIELAERMTRKGYIMHSVTQVL